MIKALKNIRHVMKERTDSHIQILNFVTLIGNVDLAYTVAINPTRFASVP